MAVIPILKMVAVICLWVIIASIALIGAWIMINVAVGFVKASVQRKHGGKVTFKEN